MIKVIASDMDGTLLGNDHKIAPQTINSIYKACKVGMRFIIVTGRSFQGAIDELEDAQLTCDYIVGSGAEVRNSKKEIISRRVMDKQLCEEIYTILHKYPIAITFCTDEKDYQIGNLKEIEENLIMNLKLFSLDMSEEEIIRSDMYQKIKKETAGLQNFQEFYKLGVSIHKIMVFSENESLLAKIREELSKCQKIAVASSFPTNLEITDIKAQKGPILKEFIESMGYQMDEVMVFGDSMNDHSMLSMDFGVTIAMENADSEIKKVAKYTTKSNEDFGVAYAIDQLLEYY